MRGRPTLGLDPVRALLLEPVPELRAAAWETAPCLITDTPTGPHVDLVGGGLVIAAGGAAKSGEAIGALADRSAIAASGSDPIPPVDRFAVVSAG